MSRRAFHTKAVGKAFHNGKAEACAFFFGSGSEKRLHSLADILYTAALVTYFYVDPAVGVKAHLEQDRAAADISVAVNDGVCDSFGHGGLQLGKFTDKGVKLREE